MDRRQSIKAVARKTAMGGTFQAALRPVDVLTLDDIAERWASYSGQPQGMAKSHLMGFESFILDQLAKGYRLDFGLVSFYPRLSGGLTSRKKRVSPSFSTFAGFRNASGASPSGVGNASTHTSRQSESDIPEPLRDVRQTTRRTAGEIATRHLDVALAMVEIEAQPFKRLKS